MNLPEALRRQKDDFIKNTPEEIVSEMAHATEQLAQSDILQNCLQVGDKAPDFTLNNSAGTKYVLSDKLSKGIVILKFFRGDW